MENNKFAYKYKTKQRKTKTQRKEKTPEHCGNKRNGDIQELTENMCTACTSV